MDGNACVSECLYDTILVRRVWTVEKDVHGLTCNVRDNDITMQAPYVGVFVEHFYKCFLSVLS